MNKTYKMKKNVLIKGAMGRQKFILANLENSKIFFKCKNKMKK